MPNLFWHSFIKKVLMKKTIVFKSKYGNYYYYDMNNRMHYCHPIFAWIISNSDIDKKNEDIEIKDLGKITKDEYNYYVDKYIIYKNNGYFNDVNVNDKKMLTREISHQNVDELLANLKQITFEVTDSCNLNCVYCSYGKLYNNYDERTNRNLSLKSAIKLFEFLKEKWDKKLNVSSKRSVIISFYGGEPLLNFNFINSIIDYLNKVQFPNIHFKFSMTTNGLLISKYIDFFVNYNFDILISLDGNEYNNSYRLLKNDTNSFNTIIKNLDFIKSKYPEYFDKHINFNSVLHNRNTIDEILIFFKEKYNKIPSIGEISTDGIATESISEFNQLFIKVGESYNLSNDKNRLNNEMFLKLPIIQSLSQFISSISNNVYYNYNNLLMENTENRINTGTCMPFEKKMFVTANGKLLPCERIGTEYYLGLITDNYVKIDNEIIAEVYNEYHKAFNNICNICYMQNGCTQCLFLNKKNSKKCNGFHNYNDYMQYLTIYISFLEKNPNLYKKIMTKVIITP